MTNTFHRGQRVWIASARCFADVLDVAPEAVKVKLDSAPHGLYSREFVVAPDTLTLVVDMPPYAAPVAAAPDTEVMLAMQALNMEALEPDRPNTEVFTPTILSDQRWSDKDGYAVVALAIVLRQCEGCGRLTAPKHYKALWIDRQNLQLARASIVNESDLPHGQRGLWCEDCARALTFGCDLCGEKRTMNQVQWTHQYHYLCKICYVKVPAQVWDEKRDAIYSMESNDD